MKIMNPLNFLEKFFTVRALEREVSELKLEKEKLKVENIQLKQKVEELEGRLATQTNMPNVVYRPTIDRASHS